MYSEKGKSKRPNLALQLKAHFLNVLASCFGALALWWPGGWSWQGICVATPWVTMETESWSC